MARETQSRGNQRTRKTTENGLGIAERERQALELRKAGASFDAIAERLGYSNRGAAYKAVNRALQSTLREPADELRALESERLDRLFLVVWRQALDGDLKAVDRALRIQDQRAKLLGLHLSPGSNVASTDHAASAIGQIGDALKLAAVALAAQDGQGGG